MSALSGTRKFLHWTLAALLLVQGWPFVAWAIPSNGTSVENVRFEKSGELVYIYYDLNAPIDKVHEVRLYLRRESELSFLYRPMNITGDVGTIVIPGQGRRIVWDITKEFPDGLAGNDYYFVVEAEFMEPEGKTPWLWIGGGAALVGGVVALLIFGGSDDEKPPPVVTGFPDPPGRP